MISVWVAIAALVVGLLLGRQWGLWTARRILREERIRAERRRGP